MGLYFLSRKYPQAKSIGIHINLLRKIAENGLNKIAITIDIALVF